jgi:hypothetical protein
MMRMNMPAQYREIIARVLGDLEFNYYHRWFDTVFLVTAVLSVVFVVAAEKYKQLSATS